MMATGRLTAGRLLFATLVSLAMLAYKLAHSDQSLSSGGSGRHSSSEEGDLLVVESAAGRHHSVRPGKTTPVMAMGTRQPNVATETNSAGTVAAAAVEATAFVSSHSRSWAITVHQPDLVQQLDFIERSLPPSLVSNFAFQRDIPRASTTEVRPHHLSFEMALRRFPIPVRTSCPSNIRPDVFCAPNLGRDWASDGPGVFPLSYSLPEEMLATVIPEKTKDCADIVPRVRSSYRFTSEAEYVAEYARSYYCITFKKGGWDVLRHYEIIAAGCMPYMIDIEHAPVYTLFHLPKQLLLEARSLPGVRFNCSAIRVTIDHRVFPREKYFDLLRRLLDHAARHLTTRAMAKYVLESMGKPNATRVLYLHAGNRKAPLRAQGNYNSWTLFHGMRRLLGAGCVDPFVIPFLYHQRAETRESMKKLLYGFGFGYAFRLEDNASVNRKDIVERIKKREFDLVIFADPTSLLSSATRTIKLLSLVQQHYRPNEIAFLHAPDIAYPSPSTQGYRPSQLYEAGIVFQREIMDCAYYAPPADDRVAEIMKRCVWYVNRNCFDDVNVQDTVKAKGLTSYVWRLPEVHQHQ